ncbi:unnamed protein product [Amaranthus hypochondriacus]
MLKKGARNSRERRRKLLEAQAVPWSVKKLAGKNGGAGEGNMTVIFLGFVRDEEMRREKEGCGGSGWAVDYGGEIFWVLAGNTSGGSQGSSLEMERKIIESLGYKVRE